MFNSCTSLSSIEIPSSVTSIGGSAFANCTALTSIDIPSSVTNIDNWAFGDCENLKEMHFKNNTPIQNVDENAFNGTTKLAFYVPKGSGKAYNAVTWKSYRLIYEEDPIVPNMLYVEGEVVARTSDYSSSIVFVANRTLPICDLFVSDHEVTQAEYMAIMGKNNNPSVFNGSEGYESAEGEIQENRPVEKVSWFDAIYYCNKRSISEGLMPCYQVGGDTAISKWGYEPHNGNSISGTITCDFNANGYRLPTEVEWEYLASAKLDVYTYSGGNAINYVAWISDNSESKTHEVKLKDRNGLGLCDMSGNVWEWCWDWYGQVGVNTSATGPETGSTRSLRGGSWQGQASNSAVTCRGYSDPALRTNLYGFRVVRTAKSLYSVVGGVKCDNLAATVEAIGSATGTTQVILYGGVTVGDLGKADTEGTIINAIKGNNNAQFRLVVDKDANIILRDNKCEELFSGCQNLISADLRGFNTKEVTSMNNMFIGCNGLESIDLSGFNTEKVEDMSGMFGVCSALTTLDVSGFETGNVEYMLGMFDACSALTALNLSNFTTDKVTDMCSMFRDCSGLTSLDLSGFNTSSVENMDRMFEGCTSLTTICVANGADWSSVSSSNNMFANCTSLPGYDEDIIDATNARIGTESNPGYFVNGISFYIKPNGGSDSNSGLSSTEPLQTMFGAISKMDNARTCYTLYIDGSLTGPQVVGSIYPNEYSGLSSTFFPEAASIVLCGATGLDADGQPLDMIDAGCNADNQGSALTIRGATYPITIKNLKITGGYTENGGGISFSAATDKAITVTLADGAVITGNTATQYGGGIYVKEGIVSLDIRGGIIYGNQAQQGGGVYYYYSNNSHFTMSKGVISGNQASSGGGVYIAEGTFKMFGGTISENTSTDGKGGAVFMASRGYVWMSGDAKIPYGVGGTNGVGKNDVYFICNSTKDNAIRVDGELSGNDVVAAITADGWQTGITVLKPGTNLIGGLTSEIIGRFALTKSGYVIGSDGTITIKQN